MTVTEWIEKNVDMDRGGYRPEEVAKIAMSAIAYGFNRSHKDAMASLMELHELLRREGSKP